MSDKVYSLFLLILCSNFSKGIESFSEESIEEVSTLRIRKKRVIDNTPHGNRPVSIEQIPYIVRIEEDGEIVCAGTILTPNIIVTAAHCFDKPHATYRVYSGSSHNDCKRWPHNITTKIVHPDYQPDYFPNDLALIVIHPPINLVHSPNRGIFLYNGHVAPYTSGTFSGWGCTHIVRNFMIFPRELRSIDVPIISLDECASIYENIVTITSKDICTHDQINRKCACDGDSGGPLVVQGHLLGIMAWSGDGPKAEHPDVFVNLSHPTYRLWIIGHIRRINGHY